MEPRKRRRLVWKLTILLTAELMVAFPVTAQTLKELEQQERVQKQTQQANEVLNSIEKLRGQLDKQSQVFRLSCLRSFGEATFCGCLLDKLPSSFSFTEYIAITVNSKEENQYSKLDKGIQKAYDMVGPVRDSCVALMNKR